MLLPSELSSLIRNNNNNNNPICKAPECQKTSVALHACPLNGRLKEGRTGTAASIITGLHVQCFFANYFAPGQVEVRSIAMSVSACPYVCLSV